MKYKNRLIVPTLITTSLLTSGLVANADEKTEESTYIETHNTAVEETDTAVNLENEERSSENYHTEHDLSATQNRQPDTEEEIHQHKENSDNYKTTNSTDETKKKRMLVNI